MTVLVQVGTGAVLVIALLLVWTQQPLTIRALVSAQSAAVAAANVGMHRPSLAAAAGFLAVLAAVYPPAIRGETTHGGDRVRWVAAGAALAVLTQSQGAVGIPLALILLALLPGRLMPRLFGAANGLLLAGAVTGHAAPVFCAACLAVPATLYIPPLRPPRLPSRAGLADLTVMVILLGATLTLPLNAVGAIVAPLMALDGALSAWSRRTIRSKARVFAMARDGFAVAAVALSGPVTAWVAILAVAAASFAGRRPDRMAFAGLGAALALFGWMQTATTAGSFALFAGFACMAATVPDLAPVAVIFLLRHAAEPGPAGIAVALAALLTATVAVWRSNRTGLLQLGPAALAALCVAAGPDGRFAALVLVILVLLTRSATRFPDSAALARAGLGGVPPLGVFPGTALAIMALADQQPWLAAPVIVAQIAFAVRALAGGNLLVWPKTPSPGWLPLVLSVLAGFLAPASLVQWWRIVAAGGP